MVKVNMNPDEKETKLVNKGVLDIESKLPYTTIFEMKVHYTEEGPNKVIGTPGKEQENNVKELPHSITVDITKVCHICFSYCKDLMSLESDDRSLANMFSYLTSVDILHIENINFQLCETCRNGVIYCYEFKTKCEKSLNLLLKPLQVQLEEKHDKPPCNSRIIEKLDKNTQTEFTQVLDTNCANDLLINHSDFKEDLDTNEEHVEYLDSDYFDITNYEKDNVGTKNSRLETIVKDPNTPSEEIKEYDANICRKRFHKEKSLIDHIKTHDTNHDNVFYCGKCKETFGSEHDLNLHSALHTKGNKWTCNKCSKEFEDRARLRRHVRRHFLCKRYTCEVCDKQFAELCALRRHARVHTGELRDCRYHCAICDKRYVYKCQLALHMASHTGARPCTCDTCGKTFASRRLLASHRLVHSDHKPYACTFCGRRFRHESTRNTHHRTHTGEKPYVCSICGKTFIQNSNLRLHMRTHTGEKPYPCETCGRKFKSRSAMNNHVRTHTGEKPRECPICCKRFASTSIANHMRRHTGEKLHACCVCPKKFVTASRLREHARTHTGEKPYKCSLCHVQYTKESLLLKHVKRHERDKNKNENKIVPAVGIEPTPSGATASLSTEPIGSSRLNSYLTYGTKFISSEKLYRCSLCPVQYTKESMLLKHEKRHERDKNKTENNIVIVRKVPVIVTDKLIITEDTKDSNEDTGNLMLQMEDGPLEVSEELILQDDSNVKPELLEIDDGQNDVSYQSTEVLNTDNTYTNNDDINSMNIVTVNEEALTSSDILEGTTVKLYRLDPNLVQIHTSGGKVMISKISNNITTNF